MNEYDDWDMFDQSKSLYSIRSDAIILLLDIFRDSVSTGLLYATDSLHFPLSNHYKKKKNKKKKKNSVLYAQIKKRYRWANIIIVNTYK